MRADVTVYERHVAPGYCVEPTGAPWWFLALRVALVLLAIALVVVVRPRVRGAPASAWLGVAIAVVASLGVSELVLRRLWRDDRDPTVRRDLPEATPDPRLGWAFRPSQTRGTYAIDAHGDRARTAGDVVDPARPTLVVAGESIAFGEGLAWDDTFGALVGRALELQVVNVGVPAFSSAQAHARLLDALARLEHPTRVVIVFVPQQIRRNAGGRTPWRLLRLVTDEPYHSSTPLTVTRDLLVASAAAVRAHGGEQERDRDEDHGDVGQAFQSLDAASHHRGATLAEWPRSAIACSRRCTAGCGPIRVGVRAS